MPWELEGRSETRRFQQSLGSSTAKEGRGESKWDYRLLMVCGSLEGSAREYEVQREFWRVQEGL